MEKEKIILLLIGPRLIFFNKAIPLHVKWLGHKNPVKSGDLWQSAIETLEPKEGNVIFLLY